MSDLKQQIGQYSSNQLANNTVNNKNDPKKTMTANNNNNITTQYLLNTNSSHELNVLNDGIIQQKQTKQKIANNALTQRQNQTKKGQKLNAINNKKLQKEEEEILQVLIAFISTNTFGAIQLQNNKYLQKNKRNQHQKYQQSTITFTFNGILYYFTMIYKQISVRDIEHIRLQIYGRTNFCCINRNYLMEQFTELKDNCISEQQGKYRIYTNYSANIDKRILKQLEGNVRACEAIFGLRLIHSQINQKKYSDEIQNNWLNFLKRIYREKQIKNISSSHLRGGTDSYLLFLRFLKCLVGQKQANSFIVKDSQMIRRFKFTNNFNMASLSLFNQNRRQENIWLHKQVVILWMVQSYDLKFKPQISQLLQKFFNNSSKVEIKQFVKQIQLLKEKFFKTFSQLILLQLIMNNLISIPQFFSFFFKFIVEYKQPKVEDKSYQFNLIKSICSQISQKCHQMKVNAIIPFFDKNQKKLLEMMNSSIGNMKIFTFKQEIFLESSWFIKNYWRTNPEIYDLFNFYIEQFQQNRKKSFKSLLTTKFLDILKYSMSKPVVNTESSIIIEYVNKTKMPFNYLTQILEFLSRGQYGKECYDVMALIFKTIYPRQQLNKEQFGNFTKAVNSFFSSKCQQTLKNLVTNLIIEIIQFRILIKADEPQIMIASSFKINSVQISKIYIQKGINYLKQLQIKNNNKFMIFQLMNSSFPLINGQCSAEIKKIVQVYASDKNVQARYLLFEQVFKTKPNLIKYAEQMGDKQFQLTLCDKLQNDKFIEKQKQQLLSKKQEIKKYISKLELVNESFNYYTIAFSKQTIKIQKLQKIISPYSYLNDYQALKNKYQVFLQTVNNKSKKNLLALEITPMEIQLLQFQRDLQAVKKTYLWKACEKQIPIKSIQNIAQVIKKFKSIIIRKQNLITQKTVTFREIDTQYFPQILQAFSALKKLQIIAQIDSVKKSKNRLDSLIKNFKILIKILNKYAKGQNQKIINYYQGINNLINIWEMQPKSFNLYDFIKNAQESQAIYKQFFNEINDMQIQKIIQFIEKLNRQETTYHFAEFKEKLNQKSKILSEQNLKQLSVKIANGVDIQIDLTQTQIADFIFIKEHVKKTDSFTDFKDYARYLKTLRRNYSNQFESKLKNAKAVIDDIIESIGFQQSGIPKYSIESILKQSQYILALDNKDSIIEKIVPLKRNKQGKVSLKKKQFSYQKLQSFKDSSLLYKIDIQNQLNGNMDYSNYQIYDTYSRIFNDYIQKNHECIKQLIKYGYDPNNILIMSTDIMIEDFKSSNLQKLSEELERAKILWIQFIKSIYSSSYLLTHCIGIKFNQFVHQCSKKIYNQNIFRIIDLKKNDFQKMFNTINIKNQAKNVESHIQNIKKMVKVIQPFERQFLAKIKMQKQVKLKLLYIKCPQSNIYYHIVSRQIQNNISPNRVFFCSQNSSFLQLFCFICRALINPCGYYYIISPYKLDQSVKDDIKRLMISLKQDNKLKQYRLCFIDQKTNHSIYHLLGSGKYFNQELINDQTVGNQEIYQTLFAKFISNCLLVESSNSGLGKTYTVQTITKKQKKQLKYLSIGGSVTFQNLKKRIQKLCLFGGENILIQIGFIEDRSQLQIFLAQIILFRSFYFQEYIYIPSEVKIFIEMENFQKVNIFQNYYILKILKQCKKIIFINQFKIENINFSQSYDENFLFTYLNIFDDQDKSNFLQNKQLDYGANLSLIALNKKKKLIQKYFLNWFSVKSKKPTFYQYTNFIKILLNYFRKFAQSQFFRLQNLKYNNVKGINFLSFRKQFLKICIDVTLLIINQTVYVSNFVQNSGNKNRNSAFNQIIDELPLLIVSKSGKQSFFTFAYLKDEKIPDIIKYLLITQNYKYIQEIKNNVKIDKINQLFAKQALNQLQPDILQKKIKQNLQQLSKNPTAPIKYSPYYKLTLDNFYKICFIIQKANCNIPIVIMGQSGVGKTALIEFLVENILKEKFYKINVHAGVNDQVLSEEIQKIKLEASRIQKQQKLWVFFDQFNTTNCLSYIKEIIMDRRFMGEKLPDNILFLAACNPYRLKKVGNSFKAGISKIGNQIEDPQQFKQIKQNLAFHVNPPSLSMIQVMWDYNQLQQKQLRAYIQKLIETVNYPNKNELVNAIAVTHKKFVDSKEISSVSLRDVARFKQIYHWFLKYMPSKDPTSVLRTRKNLQTNYRIPNQERAVILSYMFCYVYKFSNNPQRLSLLNDVEVILKFTKGYMKSVMSNEMDDFASRLIDQNDKIAINTAVKENIMISLICIMNKIPVLIVGSPGSSKTLSVNIITKHLKSDLITNCDVDFVRQFPKLMVFYYQGSVASTSESILTQFANAQQFQKKRKNSNLMMSQVRQTFPCIIFDEIGLAERSKYNPLKVLHSKLQTNKTQICFVGISNYELDAAKMSRFLILARSPPDKQDIIQTAIKLNKSYLDNYTVYEPLFKKLGQSYLTFLDKWNSNPLNKKNFFGLRDFYGYLKYISNQLKNSNNALKQSETNQIISNAIKLNFDGQTNSIKQFHQIMKIQINSSINSNIVSIISKNLQYPDSRSLLLIIKSDTVLPLINQNIWIKGKKRRVVCLYGSSFDEDQVSQNHAFEVISLILNYVAMGVILAFMDMNQNIQTSLYDLFNKNYYRVGADRFCRAAIGAKTKLKTFVHDDFNSIIYINREKVPFLDLAFLNRFEKHELTIETVLKPSQVQIQNIVSKWLDNLLKFMKQDMKIKLKRQNFILNISKQSIYSAVISLSRANEADIDNSLVIQKVKIVLLKNSTTDLWIAMRKYSQIDKTCEYSRLRQLCPNYKNCKNDMIIFTYDMKANIYNQKVESLEIILDFNEFKTQKQLRKTLKMHFADTSKPILKICLNYQYDHKHLNFLLFIAKQLKNQCKSQKQIKIMLIMHRYSLHNLKKDQINISYLHGYEQYFVETVNESQSSINLFNCKNIKVLSQKLNINMKESIDYFITEAISTISIDIDQKLGNQSLRLIYFKHLLMLGSQPVFKQKMIAYMPIIFQLKEPEQYKMLQMSIDDFNECSNITEAMLKMVKLQITSCISLFIRMLVKEDLLFVLTNYKSFIQNYLNSLSQISPALTDKIIYSFQKCKNQLSLTKESNKNLLDTKMQKLFDIFKQYLTRRKDKLAAEQQQFTMKTAKKSNQILITHNLSLIPKACENFHLIFAIKQNINSLQVLWMQKRQQIQRSKLKGQSNSNNTNYLLIIKRRAEQIIQLIVSQNIFLTQFSDSKYLQQLYLFDILYYCLFNFGEQKYVNITKNDLVRIVISHYIEILQQCEFTNKLMILTSNRKNLRFYVQVLRLIKYSRMDELVTEVKTAIKKNTNTLSIMQQILNILLKHVFNSVNIKKSVKSKQEYKEYLAYFKQIFVKVKQVCRECQDVDSQPEMQILANFYFFLQNLQKQDYGRLLEQFLNRQVGQYKLLQLQIFAFLKSNIIASHQKNPSSSLLISNFFNYKLLIKQRKTQLTKNMQQYNKIIKQYIYIINQNKGFADITNNIMNFIFCIENNQSKSFIFLQQTEKKLKTMMYQHQLIQESLDMNNNLSICLDNYFISILQKQINLNSLDEEYASFQRIIDSYESEGCKMVKIFKNAFLKFYCQMYFNFLINQLKSDKFVKIQQKLIQSRKICSHLKMFLFKKLMDKYQTAEKINQIKNRLNIQWLNQTVQYFQSRISQDIVPSNIQGSHETITKLMNIENSTEYFKSLTKIIQNIDTSPVKCYELLTFVMLKYYREPMPPALTNSFKKFIDQNIILNRQTNHVIKKLILFYVQGKINDFISSRLAGNYKKTINLLNYLNIIISLKNVCCPLTDMFFNKGDPIKKIKTWTDQRYLINSMPNPSTLRIQYLIYMKNMGNVGSSYALCSSKCDFIIPIGGTFDGKYVGCPHLRQQSICYFCKGIVGGLKDKGLTRLNEGARLFQPQKLQIQQKRIKQLDNYIIDGKNYHLKGYQQGKSAKQINEFFDLWDKYQILAMDLIEQNLETKRILQAIIFFVWLVLIEMNQIDLKQLKDMFGLNLPQIKQFLHQTSMNLNQQFFKKISKESQNIQNVTIWHFGLAKELFSYCLQFKKNQKIENLTLLNPDSHSIFDKNLYKRIFKYYDIQRESFIHNNRKQWKQLLSDKNKLIDPLIYPDLKMYKIINIMEQSSLNHLLKYYQNYIQSSHKLLAAYVRNRNQTQWLKSLRDICIFVSQLHRECNYKISRVQTKKTTKEFIKQYFTTSQQFQYMNALYDNFLKGYKYFSDMKYQLRYECQQLGSLQPINQNCQLSYCILDSQDFGNAEGRQLISFIQIATTEYNQLLKNYQTLILLALPEFKNYQFFNKTPLNPISLTQSHKFLQISQIKLNQKIKLFANYSVEEGVKNISYSFSQIQSFIISELIGLNYINSNKEQFKFMHFVGQNQYYLDRLRESPYQISLKAKGHQSKFLQLFNDERKQRSDVFFKNIKKLQTSLQHILIYYQNTKLEEAAYITIQQFIENNRINVSDILLAKETVHSLSMQHIVDLYEMVEFYSFQNIAEQLPNEYESQILSEQAKYSLNVMLSQMKNVTGQMENGLPNYSIFKTAIYRLVGRNLLIQKFSRNTKISDILLNDHHYWSKNISKSFYNEDFHLSDNIAFYMSQIQFCHTKSLLGLIPHQENDHI